MKLRGRAARLVAMFSLAVALAMAPAVQGSQGPAGPQVIRLGATADGVTVVAARPDQFVDSSAGDVLSWNWDFTHEPGITAVDSQQRNPVWTFVDAGLWSVRLEVCNAAGCSAAVKQIQVVEPCTSLADLVVGPLLEPLTGDQTYEACHTISVGGGFSVAGPVSVTFRAGHSVAIGDGFSIGSGARLRVEIDPALDAP